jgi:mRNA interferase MazF
MTETEKDFDSWNKMKKFINDTNRLFFVKEREIWWCMLGLNVGNEIDGKHDVFERPVLILKTMSKETFLVLPLTTKGADDRNHKKITTSKMVSFAKLSQSRVVSIKRFSRKVDTVSRMDFEDIKNSYLKYIS